MTLPRIAICGLHIESSTFTPYVSTEKDFQVSRGDELLARYTWMDEDWARQVEWIPILHARALPGGQVLRSDYEAWRQEIVDGLTAVAPVDAVFFDIHGAMTAQGYDDTEGDLITAVRAVVGDKPLISTSMDLHGNVSRALFAGCDLLTCYRMAPHEDAFESRKRAAVNLVERLVSGKGRPAKALVHVPVLLPGEKTSTRIEPAKSLYAMVPEVEKRPGILDAAIWVGFAWADQPRCQGAVVVAGDDAEDVKAQALRLAQHFWDVRDQFEFVAPVGTMSECLEHALDAPRPFFISDSGDNPGAGGADDCTAALSELLEWAPVKDEALNVLYASLVDPNAVKVADQAGEGAQVDVELGAHIDTREPGPQKVHATVLRVIDDPEGGRTCALKINSLTVIVTSQRMQYHSRVQYERLGLSIDDPDVVVVKIGYLEPDLYKAQADWMMALTPGGVDQDLIRLGHRRIDRPMFPFDEDVTDAKLDVEVFIS